MSWKTPCRPWVKFSKTVTAAKSWLMNDRKTAEFQIICRGKELAASTNQSVDLILETKKRLRMLGLPIFGRIWQSNALPLKSACRVKLSRLTPYSNLEIIYERNIVDQGNRVMYSSRGSKLGQTHHKTIRHHTHIHAKITQNHSKSLATQARKLQRHPMQQNRSLSLVSFAKDE